jgi:hypothetical protein
MAAKQNTVPVSKRALIQRINRQLVSEERQLKAARGARAKQDLGDYYVLNTRSNSVMYQYKDVDLEKLGREVGALREFETLAD